MRLLKCVALLRSEVFYDAAGQRIACSEDPIAPRGETLDELRQMLQAFQIALQALLEKNSLLAG
jgi:hypothetical protein